MVVKVEKFFEQNGFTVSSKSESRRGHIAHARNNFGFDHALGTFADTIHRKCKTVFWS